MRNDLNPRMENLVNQCPFCLADHWPHCPEAAEMDAIPPAPAMDPDAAFAAGLAAIIKAEIADEN